MSTPTGWRIIQNADDWMRQQEKRSMHEARRPQVTKAADLMGPGLAPTAVEIKDWNAEETEFNGIFFSRPSALHTPDPTRWWIGQVLAQQGGYGIQQVWDYREVTLPVTVAIRRFGQTGGIRVFGAWA